MPNEAAKHPIVEFNAYLGARSSTLTAILPSTLPVEKFKQVVMTAVMQNPELAIADRLSMWNACRRAATDGLLPDGREAVLVIYKTKQKDGSYKELVNYVPMVAGIYKRTRNSGEIATLYAHAVHKNDVFRIKLGYDKVVEHEPSLGERGEIIGAYACVQFKDGSRDVEWMHVSEINKVRQASRAPNSPAWTGWFDQMCCKAVIKRMGKRLPVNSDIAGVLMRADIDDASDESLPAIAAPPASMALAHEPPLDMPIVEEQIKEPAPTPAPQAEASTSPKAVASVPSESAPAPQKAVAPAAVSIGPGETFASAGGQGKPNAPDEPLPDSLIVVAEFSRQIDEATDKAALKIVWEEIERADVFPVDKDMLKMKAQNKQAVLNIAKAGR
jgi:recombination protein RecT